VDGWWHSTEDAIVRSHIHEGHARPRRADKRVTDFHVWYGPGTSYEPIEGRLTPEDATQITVVCPRCGTRQVIDVHLAIEVAQRLTAVQRTPIMDTDT
jgi:hypothetical protein